MKKTPRVLCFVAFCIVHYATAYAADLIEVYRQALDNDPIFKQAYSNFMAATQAIPQARAALLPQLNVSTLAGRYVQSSNVGGPFSLNGQETYNAAQWKLAASQAVFNYQSWARVQLAKASVKAAHATFNDAAQRLILRTAKAYCDTLLAKDTLNYAEAKKRANKRQLDQAQQRFNVGLDAITSVYEAKAAYDQSIALVISSQNQLINQNENLRKLTNHVYDELASLRDSKIPLIKPEPNNVDEWVATGIKQNYNLFAAKYNLQAARENIKAQTAAAWPSFALEGNSFRNRNHGAGNSNFFVPTEQMISSVSINMNFPVFQGGLVEANTRQAQYNFQSSSEQLEQSYRDVVVNSRIAFNTIIDGISKVKADRQTIISRENALDSTEAQFQVGTRTMVDVVNAQERLFESQEQLAGDQYGLINAFLNLKYLSGNLNVADLEEINSWLATQRFNGLPAQQQLKLATLHKK